MIRYHSAVTQYGTRYNLTVDTDNEVFYKTLQNVIRLMIDVDNAKNTGKAKSMQKKLQEESYEVSEVYQGSTQTES